MSFTMDMYNLLIRYTKDSEGLDVTLQDLYKLPYWRCVWGNWRAKAYYQMDGFYTHFEDVPEGLESYSIMDEVFTSYWTERGELKSQSMDKATCKKIYGE